jgi:hypothetical protein
MPPRPIPVWMRWQVEQLPSVVTNFRRPFYVRPSNNALGPPVAREAKPAPLVHVPKPTRREALHGGSNGTVVPVGLKVTDG